MIADHDSLCSRYSAGLYETWTETVGESSQYNLSLPLISRDPATGLISVNFSPQVFTSDWEKLIRDRLLDVLMLVHLIWWYLHCVTHLNAYIFYFFCSFTLFNWVGSVFFIIRKIQLIYLPLDFCFCVVVESTVRALSPIFVSHNSGIHTPVMIRKI